MTQVTADFAAFGKRYTLIAAARRTIVIAFQGTCRRPYEEYFLIFNELFQLVGNFRILFSHYFEQAVCGLVFKGHAPACSAK